MSIIFAALSYRCFAAFNCWNEGDQLIKERFQSDTPHTPLAYQGHTVIHTDGPILYMQNFTKKISVPENTISHLFGFIDQERELRLVQQ